MISIKKLNSEQRKGYPFFSSSRRRSEAVISPAQVKISSISKTCDKSDDPPLTLATGTCYPFNLLKTNVITHNQSSNPEEFSSTLKIQETSNIEVILTNEKGQSTTPFIKYYKEISLLNGENIKKTIPGLSYAYYEGNWDVIPDLSKLTPIKKGIVTDFDVGIAINKDNFGIKYTGYIEITEVGMYYFKCTAGVAGYLKIHDKLICSVGTNDFFDNSENKVESSGAIALKKGMHPIEIVFYENNRWERLRFYHKRSEEAEWNFLYLEDFFKIKKK